MKYGVPSHNNMNIYGKCNTSAAFGQEGKKEEITAPGNVAFKII